MTRINVIPVEELTTKHLVAEYRENPRAFALARRERKYQIELLKASGAGYTERYGK